MKQGLLKTTSLTALVIAGGMMANSVGAFAADLGGNCCADLEERVADLEATVARKGTRKTSLEVWGQVNKEIIAWDDGINHNAFLGTDNTNSSTRFGFRGNAQVFPGVKAGYSIMMEWNTGARTFGISQFTDKTIADRAWTGTSGVGSDAATNSFGSTDAGVAMRDANWWIESDRLGRLTVGRYDSHNSSLQFNIDLAGIATTVGGGNPGLNSGSGLVFRTNNQTGSTAFTGAAAQTPQQSLSGFRDYTNYSVANVTDGIEGSPRVNGAYYTTPTWHGFSFATGIGGEAQDDKQCANPSGAAVAAANGCTDSFNYGLFYSGVLKFAQEFNGFRVAAAIAAERSNQESGGAGIYSQTNLSNRSGSHDWGLSLSALHVPTGLFAQGYYNEYTRGHDEFIADGSGNPTAYTLGTNGAKDSDTAKELLIQAGIVRNWFGIGNTVPFAQYDHTTNGFNTFGLRNANATLLNGVSGASAGNLGTCGTGVTTTTSASCGAGGSGTAYSGDNTKATMWGLGIVQNVDAAAMSLYASYNDWSLKSDNCSAAGGCKDISTFTTGALIKF